MMNNTHYHELTVKLEEIEAKIEEKYQSASKAATELYKGAAFLHVAAAKGLFRWRDWAIRELSTDGSLYVDGDLMSQISSRLRNSSRALVQRISELETENERLRNIIEGSRIPKATGGEKEITHRGGNDAPWSVSGEAVATGDKPDDLGN